MEVKKRGRPQNTELDIFELKRKLREIALNTDELLNGNCQHSCRKCHSEFVRNSASIKESFSGFSQTWFGSVQFRVFRAQRSGFFDLAAS